jgi:hypothetical protein
VAVEVSRNHQEVTRLRSAVAMLEKRLERTTQEGGKPVTSTENLNDPLSASNVFSSILDQITVASCHPTLLPCSFLFPSFCRPAAEPADGQGGSPAHLARPAHPHARPRGDHGTVTRLIFMCIGRLVAGRCTAKLIDTWCTKQAAPIDA